MKYVIVIVMDEHIATKTKYKIPYPKTKVLALPNCIRSTVERLEGTEEST